MRRLLFLVAFLAGFFGLLILLSSCTDCGPWRYHSDGSYGPWWFHSDLDSMPAYPPEIAFEPVIWTEGGQSWLIDRTGSHLLK